MKDVKALIEELRRVANVETKQKIADILGVAYSTIQNWESGKKGPTEENLAKIEATIASIAGGRMDAEFGHVNGNGKNGRNRLAGAIGHGEAADEPKPVVTSVGDHFAIGLAKEPLSMKEAKALGDSKPMKHILGIIRVLGIQPLSAPACLFFDKDDMQATFYGLISPEARRNILKSHNQHNRDPNVRSTTSLAIDMKTGGYVLTGETIIFHSDGDLADGQSRIWAALSDPVLAGKDLAALITVGVPPTAFRVINSARGRPVKDRMVVAGRAFADVRTKTLSLLNRWENSIDGADAINSPSFQRFNGSVAFDLDKHYVDEMGLESALEFIHGLRWKIGKGLPKHVATFAYLFMAQKSASCARAFLKLVVDGGAPAGSPILAARDKLTALAQAKLTAEKARLRTGEQVKLLALAWNAYCAGRSSEHLVNKHNKSPSELLGNLIAPVTKIEASAESIVPEEAVAATVQRAKQLETRKKQLRMDRMSDIDGSFIESVRRGLENA